MKRISSFVSNLKNRLRIYNRNSKRFLCTKKAKRVLKDHGVGLNVNNICSFTANTSVGDCCNFNGMTIVGGGKC